MAGFYMVSVESHARALNAHSRLTLSICPNSAAFRAIQRARTANEIVEKLDTAMITNRSAFIQRGDESRCLCPNSRHTLNG